MSDSVMELVNMEADRQQALFRQFAVLYERAFPDLNEREDTDQWADRLSHDTRLPDEPVFHLIVTGSDLEAGPAPRVTGGAAFEYYPKSGAGLLTYIAIDETQRKKGLAGLLLREAVRILHAEARRAGRPLAAVFAEANDPSETPPEQDVMSPADRLAIFQRMGWKWLDLDYVQPALRDGKERVRNLLLLCLPDAVDSGKTIRVAPVRDFLAEFYAVLGVPEPSRDRDFIAMTARLEGDVFRLKELPLVENPVLCFEKAAICLHAVSFTGPAAPPLSGQEDASDSRSNFKSFELDLLSYRFQSLPPFVSRCVSPRAHDLVIHYPDALAYDTEGRTVPLLAPAGNRRKRVRAILSETVFRQSGVRIWHLVLQPVKGEGFSEYDLIKLAKTYGGFQESNNLLGSLRFSFAADPGKTLLLPDLITALAPGLPGSPPEIRAGTMEIDVEEGCSVPEARGLVDLLRSTFGGKPEAKDELEGIFRSDSRKGLALKALCGIVTGIFDFARMSFAEMLDTFEPTVLRGTALIRVHRGTLVSLDHEDDMLSTCWDTTGISPYLVLPQAILIHNDTLVDSAETRLAAVMGGARARPADEKKMEAARQAAERHLRFEYVPNVFQYPTERQILDEGARHRGSLERTEAAREQLKELATRIASLRAAREERAESVSAIMLAFLSGTTLQPVLMALAEDWYGCVPSVNRQLAWGAFVAIFLTIMVFLMWTKWMSRR